MKLLMIYMDRFAYLPTIKTLSDFPDQNEGRSFEEVQVAFIQAEKEDEENSKPVEKKILKNLKWIAGKNNTRKIILHSFAHLSDSKADPGFTKSLFNSIEQRLTASGYEVYQTPFGYFLDLDVKAPGHSLARVFKNF